MSLKINFYADKKLRDSIPEPIPASKMFPSWFSQLPNKKSKCPFGFARNSNQQIDPYTLIHDSSLGVKGCPGIHDFLSFGYIIPSWTTFIFREDEQTRLLVNWVDSPYDIDYTAHPSEQFSTLPNKPIYNHFGKISTPWTIKTEKNVSCLITHPVWHRNNVFTTATGIIHTDVSPFNIPWFFEYNYKVESGLDLTRMNVDKQIVDINTPLVLIIPFYRKDFKSVINYVDSDEMERYTNVQVYRAAVNGIYSNFRKKILKFSKLFE